MLTACPPPPPPPPPPHDLVLRRKGSVKGEGGGLRISSWERGQGWTRNGQREGPEMGLGLG